MKEAGPRINISIDLPMDATEKTVKNITVTAASPEARDLAMERLRSRLPQIELLESALQNGNK